MPGCHAVHVESVLAELRHVALSEACHVAGRLHAVVLVYLEEVYAFRRAQADVIPRCPQNFRDIDVKELCFVDFYECGRLVSRLSCLLPLFLFRIKTVTVDLYEEKIAVCLAHD